MKEQQDLIRKERCQFCGAEHSSEGELKDFGCWVCGKKPSNPQKDEGELDRERVQKIIDTVLDSFVECPTAKGADFTYDGKWYAPKFGCDTLDYIIDDFYTLLSSHEERIRAEIKEGILNYVDKKIKEVVRDYFTAIERKKK